MPTLLKIQRVNLGRDYLCALRRKVSRSFWELGTSHSGSKQREKASNNVTTGGNSIERFKYVDDLIECGRSVGGVAVRLGGTWIQRKRKRKGEKGRNGTPTIIV